MPCFASALSTHVNSLPQTENYKHKNPCQWTSKMNRRKKEESKFCFRNLGRPQVLIKTTLVFGSAGEFNFPTLIHGQNLSVYNIPRTLEEQLHITRSPHFQFNANASHGDFIYFIADKNTLSPRNKNLPAYPKAESFFPWLQSSFFPVIGC